MSFESDYVPGTMLSIFQASTYSHNNPTGVTLLSLFYREGEGGSEKLCNFPHITSLARVRAGFAHIYVLATHSSTLAWRIPWTEEPGRLQSMEPQSQTRLSDRVHTCNSEIQVI